MQAGVIDPTKVTRTALQNAASIAGLLLTTEALIVEKKEDEAGRRRPAGRRHGRDVLRDRSQVAGLRMLGNKRAPDRAPVCVCAFGAQCCWSSSVRGSSMQGGVAMPSANRAGHPNVSRTLIAIAVVAATVAAMATTAPSVALAQQPTKPASANASAAAASTLAMLIGGVLSADSMRLPLAGSTIAIEAQHISATADDIGAFTLMGIPAGMHLMTIHHAGYQIGRFIVNVAPNDTIFYTAELQPTTAYLPAVHVDEAAPRSRNALLAERMDRAAKTGVLLDRTELAKYPASTLTIASRTHGISLANVDGKFYAISQRGMLRIGGVAKPPSAKSAGTGDSSTCFLKIFVDGMPFADKIRASLDDFNTDDIEAVEIYTGVGRIPPEYNATGSACGVIAIWRRNDVHGLHH